MDQAIASINHVINTKEYQLKIHIALNNSSALKSTLLYNIDVKLNTSHVEHQICENQGYTEFCSCTINVEGGITNLAKCKIFQNKCPNM